MMEEGWIKIYRSILDKGWSDKPDFVALWIHLLLQANHRKKEYFWNGRTVILEPGQFITGRKVLSKKTGIDQHKVDRILKVFESEQQIEQRTTSTSRLISIKNWSVFQKVEQRVEQRVSNGRATGEQRVSTKQEGKNDKNDKNVRRERGFTPPTLIQVCEYFQMNGFSTELAEKAFRYYSESNWKDSRGNPVKNWKQKMISVWFNKNEKTNAKHSDSNNSDKIGRVSKQDLADFINRRSYPVPVIHQPDDHSVFSTTSTDK